MAIYFDIAGEPLFDQTQFPHNLVDLNVRTDALWTRGIGMDSKEMEKWGELILKKKWNCWKRIVGVCLCDGRPWSYAKKIQCLSHLSRSFHRFFFQLLINVLPAQHGAQLRTNYNAVRKQFVMLAKVKKQRREQQQAARKSEAWESSYAAPLFQMLVLLAWCIERMITEVSGPQSAWSYSITN